MSDTVLWIIPVRTLEAAWRRLMWPLHGIGQHGGGLFGLCGILLLWGGVFHSLSVERSQAIRSATDNAANLARAFEEQIVRSIKAVDQTLLYVREARARDPSGFSVYAWAQDTRFLVDLTLQVSLIDRSGRITGSSLFPDASPMDLSDREYVKVHGATSEDVLFISKPLQGRATNKPVIMMSRKMISADGSFDGVVAVSVASDYLSQFYDSVDLGGNGVVTLVGTDGVVRARASAGNMQLGQLASDSRLLRAYNDASSGILDAVSSVDNVRRIYAYRGVRSYPLIVLVGISEDEILANYQVNRRSYLAVATAMTLLLLLVRAKITRHQAGLRATQARLHASEAAYAQKSDLLEAAVENMSQGIIMVDADRRVQVCNRRAMIKLDLPEALMAGQPLFDDVLRFQWESGEYGEDGGELEPWLRELALSGGIADGDQTYERTRPNGQVLEIHSTKLRGGGVVRTFTDITARNAAETVLRDARDEADRAARAKSEFLAMMSHEIRSPMNGVLGLIELLRDTRLEPEQTGMVELAHQSAASLLRILNDVLDFSKIEAGAIGVSTEPADIRDLVRMLVEAITVIAERKGLRMERRVAEDVPDWIIVDPVRLRQILGNLLGNAIKFTAAGSVEISVSTGKLPSGEVSLEFAVHDSGIGMAPDVLERLFEPFMQEDASTAKIFGGTGLGLSISRRLARLLGGDIEVASNRGSGSVFTLAIPLFVAAPDAAARDTAMILPDDNALRGLRVLAAEDQPINRALLMRQLDRFDVILTLVEDGRQALAALAAGAFDLLVTDCHMPGMDGMELTRRIRADEGRIGARRLPILGLTADVTTETRANCLAAGMDDVASKPINLHRFERALRHMMARQGSPAGPGPADADTPPAVLFDNACYNELFGDEPDEGEQWLAAYVETATSATRLIRNCIASDDRSGLKAAAHQLAGSSVSVGAVQLGLLARELESASIEATPLRLEQFDAGLMSTIDATFKEISRFVAAGRATVA